MTGAWWRCAVCVAVLAGAPGWAASPAPAGQEDLDTPFVITPTNVVSAMLDLAQIVPGDRVIDLGSGDGRIVIAAAQRGATAVGIEIDATLVERSREAARRLKLDDRASFVTQDLFDTDFSDASVVTLYLLPDVNKRLAPRFLATLRPGTRIVSHDYGLGDWPPDRTIVVDAPDKPVNVEKKSTLHFWRVPARVEGRWKGRAAGDEVELRIAQRYQRASGALAWGGRRYRFTGQPIDGERIALQLATRGEPAVEAVLHALGDGLVGSLRRSGAAPVEVRLQRT